MITEEVIGKNIRVQMAMKNIGTTQLSKGLGVSMGSARQYQQGKIFDVRRLQALAEYFEITLDELISS